MVKLARISIVVAVMGLAGIAAIGVARAGDMPVKAKAPPPPVAYDWSGVYVGFSVGGMWVDVDRRFFNPVVPPFDFSTATTDGVWDVHGGAQVQWGNWVLGFEAGLTHCFRECRATALVPTTTIYGEHKVTDLFTVGPRLGFAWDRWMIYGTGGYANATLKAAYCVTGGVGLNCSPTNGTVGPGQSRNDGWFAGGGFEYMVHKGALVDVTLGAEYQHWDVSSTRAFCLAPACNSIFDYDLGAKGDIVRARLTIKTQGYGWWGTP